MSKIYQSTKTNEIVRKNDAFSLTGNLQLKTMKKLKWQISFKIILKFNFLLLDLWSKGL